MSSVARNLVGNTFDRLYVTRLIRIENKTPVYECKCSCGNVCEKTQSYLLDNRITHSCGCIRKENSSLINLKGEQFGDLTVIERAEDYIPANGKPETQWLCECSCGNLVTVQRKYLRSGSVTNCGDPTKHVIVPNNYKHGSSGTRLYRTWQRMMWSCYNQSYALYHNIGARGIEVCDVWKDFNVFGDWSLKNNYNDNMFLIRAYLDINFCPENCYYSPERYRITNMSLENKVSGLVDPNNNLNQLYMYQGNILTLENWAKLSGYPIEYFNHCLSSGMAIDMIMSTPPEGYMKNGMYSIDIYNRPVDINKYIYIDE